MFPLRRINGIGRNCVTGHPPKDKALAWVYGDNLGLDMMRRDLQHCMGDQKKPWGSRQDCLIRWQAETPEKPGYNFVLDGIRRLGFRWYSSAG